MTKRHELKTQDQVLYVPSHIDRRGRSAQQLAEEVPATQEGFVTSLSRTIVFCRFYYPDGNLRTVANSEACNFADLVPYAQPDRDDKAVLSQALARFGDRDDQA